MTNFIGALVGSPELIGPFLVFDIAASCVLMASVRHLHAFIAFSIVHHIAAISHISCQILAQLEVLRGPTEHIMQLAIRIQSSDDLVLGWHVQLLHDLVQFLAQLNVLSVQGGDLSILLGE